MKNYQQMHYWYSSHELSDRHTETFDSRTEVMRLNCSYSNAEGTDDLVLHDQTLVRVGALLFAV